jgi:DNA repair protein RadC
MSTSQKDHLAIAQMQAEDRPRERMARMGIRRLRDAEVLALVIGSGTRDASSLELAQSILKRLGGPAGLQLADAGELQEVPGVGAALAARIVGAMELARRAAFRSAGARPPRPDSVAADASRGPG